MIDRLPFSKQTVLVPAAIVLVVVLLTAYADYTLALWSLPLEEVATESDHSLTWHLFQTSFRPLGLFALMSLGIFSSLLYEEANTTQQAGKALFSPRRAFRRIVLSPRLWMAVAASPFVFYVTYFVARQQPDGFIAMFYAFQNGFFWQTVLGGFKKQIQEQAS